MTFPVWGKSFGLLVSLMVFPCFTDLSFDGGLSKSGGFLLFSKSPTT